jgi:hypothetical protein
MVILNHHPELPVSTHNTPQKKKNYIHKLFLSGSWANTHEIRWDFLHRGAQRIVKDTVQRQ